MKLLLAILRALNPFGPASGDWHSIDCDSAAIAQPPKDPPHD